MMWVAINMTYYFGGLSYVDGVNMDDRHSVKISGSTGAIVRFGADFTTLAVGWQTIF